MGARHSIDDIQPRARRSCLVVWAGLTMGLYELAHDVDDAPVPLAAVSVLGFVVAMSVASAACLMPSEFAADRAASAAVGAERLADATVRAPTEFPPPFVLETGSATVTAATDRPTTDRPTGAPL